MVCIFYEPGQDTESIEHKCPLIYESEISMNQYLNSPEGYRIQNEWKRKGLTFVTRKVNMLVV